MNKRASDVKFLSIASECLKALAHPVRLRVLFLLETERLTVGEIAKECGVVSHVASEHLRLMHRCGILSREKDGQKTYYQICESHVHAILDCMRNKFSENLSCSIIKFNLYEKSNRSRTPTNRTIHLIDVRTPANGSCRGCYQSSHGIT